MTATAKPIIGILGGMGPEATVDLMRRVIAATPAHDDCDHAHLIVDSNPNIPSRIAALIEGTGDDPEPELVRMARRLEKAGASALAIACNTAYHYAPAITASVSVPLLDMVALATETATAMNLRQRRIGILGSTAVIKLGLYEKALAARGITLVAPTEQARLMDVIKAVKRGDTGSRNRDAFAHVAGELMGNQVDALMIACTELSVLADSLDQATAYFDTLDLLARRIVAFGLRAGGARLQNDAIESTR